MIKQMAWNTFKNTGNINSFLEFIEAQRVEKSEHINNGINVNDKITDNIIEQENIQKNNFNNL